jgi:hypothetical protein
VQIVQGQHALTEDFVVFDQMPELGTAEVAARRVGTLGKRTLVFLKFLIFQIDRAVFHVGGQRCQGPWGEG